MDKRIFNLQNLNYFSFMIYFGFMYMGLPYSVHAIGLFFLIQLLLLTKQGSINIIKINKLLLIPIFYYLIHIISVIYSSNKPEANFDLQVKLSFLILPILFALKKEKDKTDLFKLLKLYSIISLIAGIIYILKGFYLQYHSGIFPTYMTFSHPLHPSYLAMYYTVNIAFSTTLFIKVRKVDWGIILSIITSLTILYLAESKAGLIATFFLVLFILFKILYHNYRKLSLITILIFGIVFSSSVLLIPRFKSLFTTTLNYENTLKYPEKVVESTALRILAWDASIKVIKKHPIIGVGAGDIKDELAIIYSKLNYKKPLAMRMNCHNQFIETTVGQGIIGLIVLIILLLALFINKNHQFISQMFGIIIITNILFESMFNVQAGVVFFVFIYSMIISSKAHKTTE